eukprot:g206.t1
MDMNRPELKRLFIPIMEEELFQQPSQAFVEKAQQELEAAGFSGQAYARDINLFYLRDGLRERIELNDGKYQVLNTDYAFTREEIKQELHSHPERFSPNVIMRPLYQEKVLPNLAYIGGGGELAYWLERKEQFAHFGLNFPMLIRRNSLLWLDKGTVKKMSKLELEVEDLFVETEALLKQFVKSQTDNELTIAEEKAQLEALFTSIADKARDIDPTLAKAIEAEYTRQAKSVDNLEGRLMRAEKQKHEIALNQIRKLKEKLFPNNGLQERYDNFLNFYTRYGHDFISTLIEVLNPLHSTFFQFFGVNLLDGNPVEVLRAPNTAVISQAIAQKYFGLQNPVGKTLLLDNEYNYTVTGVMAPMPSNTHFNYDMLLSLSSRDESRETLWGNMNFNTYVMLHEGTDVDRFAEKFNQHLIRNYFAPEIEQYIGMPWQDFIDAGNAFDFSLFPAADIHLKSDKDGELAANSDIKYVWIFSIIGAFILLIACINFMNLSTARSAIRAREIGVRKVVGATRKDLVGQFLDKKLGFDREQLLMVNDAYALEGNLQAFKARMQDQTEVLNATVTGYLPIPSWRGNSSYFKGRKADLDQAIMTNDWHVDHDYIETMGMNLVAGRDFSTEFQTDSMATIINQTMATYYNGDPIGQELSNFGEDGSSLLTYHIIGVVEDFNYESLRQTIEPLALFLGEAPGYVTMRIKTDNLPAFINRLETNWNEMAPGQPFSYTFMDDSFDQMYDAEQRIGSIIGTFAFLAIFIACIGLIGLSTFIAQQRTKEIGIRKVLGASTIGLVQLLSRDFVRLVIVALIIAVPLAWWAMNTWLQSFAYRIELGPGVFALAAVVAVLIALATVSIQSIRAALANPVESLKGE